MNGEDDIDEELLAETQHDDDDIVIRPSVPPPKPTQSVSLPLNLPKTK